MDLPFAPLPPALLRQEPLGRNACHLGMESMWAFALVHVCQGSKVQRLLSCSMFRHPNPATGPLRSNQPKNPNLCISKKKQGRSSNLAVFKSRIKMLGMTHQKPSKTFQNTWLCIRETTQAMTPFSGSETDLSIPSQNHGSSHIEIHMHKKKRTHLSWPTGC